MKRLFLTVICIIAILIILSSPHIVIDGVRQGIKLNLYSVIPALLPFMILTNIMIKYNLCEYISFIFRPILSKIFKVSSMGCFAIIIGFTCGYPMGAKTIGDLYVTKKISKSEACYLITFCNNCSITFLLNYILFECLNSQISSIIALILVYTPPVITGIINRFILKPKINPAQMEQYYICNTNPIWEAIKSISILCVYIICFTVISKWIGNLSILSEMVKSILSGFMEITSGSIFIVSAPYNITLKTFLILMCAVFGGISITFQSFEQLPCNELKRHYLLGKMQSVIIFILLFEIVTIL